jgi:hypothetical protein
MDRKLRKDKEGRKEPMMDGNSKCGRIENKQGCGVI